MLKEKAKEQKSYRVINLVNGQSWEGSAYNAKEAYKNIDINKGDITLCSYGKNYRLSSTKEW